METTIQDIIDRAPAAFVAERAAGMDVAIQVHLEGNGGGDWFATIQDQKLEISKGIHFSPNLTVQAKAQDVLDIYQGKLDAMRAFMQGKLRVSGDMGLAMRLIGVFKMP